MNIKPKVALSQDFLARMSKFPSKIQSQIIKWSVQFQSDPTASGINYEKIRGKDPNLRSVRINQDWREIVFKPSNGNVYVLLYVDKHDDAYDWAKNRKILVNPENGSLQVVLTEAVDEPQSNQSESQTSSTISPPSGPPLFSNLTDKELMSLGTPEDLIPNVRKVTSEEELDGLEKILPVEAYEGLFLNAAGDSISQILASREVFMPEKVDVDDFDKALDTPESQSRFVIIKDDEALITAMNASLEMWRIFLHPTQKRFAINDRNGPMRVLGGAGTGKTVLAMHRAVWLAEKYGSEQKKILFTTFTKNLAIDIEQNLKKLCPPSLLKRIEITNLDAWVYRLLRKHDYDHKIVYDYLSDDAAKASWQKALAVKDSSLQLDESFYREEWEKIILAQGITDLDGYRRAKRVGRRSILNRKKRDAARPVFEEYRNELSFNRLKEVDDAYRDAAGILLDNPKEQQYASIIIDETQDLGAQALKLLRAMIPEGKNDLFFVGDGHQRIYGRNRAVMGQCGINIRGRARKLYLNYRTTDEIRKYALSILEGREIDDLDGGVDENKRYKSLSHGPSPRIEQVPSMEAAAELIPQILEDWSKNHEDPVPLTSCVTASKNKHLNDLKDLIEKTGKTCTILKRDQSDTQHPDTLRLSTMHRAKGLEFDQVIVTYHGQFPPNLDEEDQTPHLIYVALTRARKHAAIINWGSV